MRQVEWVTDVHHVHAWSLTSGRNVFSSRICVRGLQGGERVLRQARKLLRERFNIYFSTIQMEEYRPGGEEAAADIDIVRSHAGSGQASFGKVYGNR